MNREKIIAKLEKEVKRTYAIKTSIFDGTEKVSEEIIEKREPFVTITIEMADKILALLKEQDVVVKQWTKEIADNQLAHAPDELDRENWDYKKGIWDGLQIAWNIISEGR